MSQIFLTSAADKVMDDIVTHLPFSPLNSNLAFITTAAETEIGDHWWIKVNRDKLATLGFLIDEFSITGLTSDQIETKLANKQVIFVDGGSTAHLLKQSIKFGFDKILKRKLSEGVVYVGSSAGSVVLDQSNLKIVDYNIYPHSSKSNKFNENVNNVQLTDYQYLYINQGKAKFIDVK